MQDIFEKTDLLVMGAGNILWADEGFGVRCVERFNELYRAPEKVKVMDGGTLGMYLLEYVEATRDLFFFDCADLHAEPGTLKVLTDDEILRWSSTKISPHQTGLNEVLALAELQRKEPGRIAVVAVQPKELEDYGGSLTDVVRPMVDKAVEEAYKLLTSWGYKFERRAPGEKVPSLSYSSLNQDYYEATRPSDAEAPRMGDVRFFPKDMA